MQDMIARLMQTNPALAYALMNNGLDASTPGYDPSSAYPVQGTPGMPQFSKPEPAVYRNGTPPAAAHHMPFVEGTPGMQAQNLPMPTDKALWDKITKSVQKGVEGMKPNAAAATPPAGELPPKPPIPSYNIPGGVGSLGPSMDRIEALNNAPTAPQGAGNVNLGREIKRSLTVDPSKLAALNASGDVGVPGAMGAAVPPTAPYNPAMAPDPNAMSMAQKIGMMVGLGGGQAPGAPPINQEMTNDPMGNMTVAGTGYGLLGPAQGGFNPAMAGPRPGMDDPNAMTPAYRPDPTNDPNALTPALPGKPNRMGAKPTPPQKPMFDPANNGKPMDVPLPPQRPDAAKPGPWGANPTQAAWAGGAGDGSWGAPDDRYVGAFANANMPAQKGLLWPFSN